MTHIRYEKGFNYPYLLFNLILLLILPLLSLIGEHHFEGTPVDWTLFGKWSIFWSIGLRLFLAGTKQASTPEFTATAIFKLKGRESFVIIRELGFANIALGVMGILSVINAEWRLLAAIAGGLYFGMAGIQHLFRRPDSTNEVIALIYDMIVSAGVILYLISALIFKQQL
jgi:hypothetical protein